MPAFKQRHPLFGWTRGTQFGCTRRAVHVWHVWEIKARTEGRGFCRHKEDFCRGTILQFQQMFPFGIAVCGGLFFYSTSNISLIWNFFFFLMLLMQLIWCLLGSHLCFSEKRKHRLSLNQTETLKPLPDTCYPPGRSPIKFFSGLSCFDVNASSAYPNEELRPKGLSVFCKIQTLHCLVKYQAYLLKSCWVRSTRVQKVTQQGYYICTSV